MQIFTPPLPQVLEFFRKLLKPLEKMSVEESVPYLLEKKLELIKYILMMESQMEEVKIRWTSKNNEPRREEYLHADLENLNQQYKSVVLSSPAVDTFKEALLIILPIDE